MSDPHLPAGHASLRASDADRDRVAEALREAYAEGRLDAVEHQERVDRVYQAKTLGDLAPLVADLPTRHVASAPAVNGMPQVPAEYQPGAKVTAIFAEQTRSGRWMVPARTFASAVFGSVTIDLREAVLSQREIVITANAIFGSVQIKVPHGVVVHDEGTAVFGSRSGATPASAGDVPITADSPVVIVRGTALFGEVSVKYPKQNKFKKLMGR